MTKLYYRRTFAPTLALSFWGLIVVAVCYPAKSQANAIGLPPSSARRADAFPGLDSKRVYALGMVETGNNDRAIGLAGEISRYQLAPPVWKSYSRSMDYRNPDVALQVARQHWSYLAGYFTEKTGRVPTDYDMYVLWNTRLGYYAHHGFSKRAISLVVQDRANRFVNLVNRRD